MMGRVMLLILVVALIVTGLAWVTGSAFHDQAAAAPQPGPGEAAWLNQVSFPMLASPSIAPLPATSAA